MKSPFALLEPSPQAEMARAAYGSWLTEAGETVVQFYRTDKGYLVRFCNLADFEIAAADWSVTCRPVPDCGITCFDDLFLNQVAPLIQSHHGATILHASAAATPHGALAFVGGTGRGKSTLAASFARAGHGFMSDDGLEIESDALGWLARPNRPSFRMRADSAAAIAKVVRSPDQSEFDSKSRVAASDRMPFHNKPERLCAVYLLGSGEADTTCIMPLRPADALSQMIQHSLILDAVDKLRTSTHFSRIAELAESGRCFALDYPRRYDALSGVIETVIAHAGQTGAIKT
jgi:hypothetical protein